MIGPVGWFIIFVAIVVIIVAVEFVYEMRGER